MKTTKKFLDSYFYVFCFLCIAAGVVLRFVLINAPLSYDEIYSVITSDPKLTLHHIVSSYFLPDVHPPLYNIFLYYWNHLFTYVTAFTARIPSIICALLALVLAWFYFPKKRDKMEKYIFVSLLAVNYAAVYYASDTRSYSLMLLLSVLITFIYLSLSEKLAQDKPIKNKHVAALAALTLIMTYTHYFGAIMCGVYFILLTLLAFKKKKYYWNFIVAYGIVLLLVTPWIAPQAIANMLNLNGGWWGNSVPVLDGVSGIVFTFFLNSTVAAAFAIPLLYALAAMYKTEQEKIMQPVVFMTALAILLTIVFCLILRIKISFLIPRFYIALLPALYLFCAYFMTYAARKNIWFVLINMFVITTALYFTANKLFETGKENIDSPLIVNYLTHEAPGKQKRFFFAQRFYPKKAENAVFAYYFQKMGEPAITMVNIDDEEELQDLYNNHPGDLVWAPTCYIWPLPHNYIIERVGDSCLVRLKEVEPHKRRIYGKRHFNNNSSNE